MVDGVSNQPPLAASLDAPLPAADNQEAHIRRGHPITFGLILFFSLIEGCITAALVGMYNSGHDYPDDSYRDRLRFLVFVSWWTVVFSAAYMAFFLFDAGSFLVSIASHGIWMAITWLFWLAGVAAYTAALGGGIDCSATPVLYCNTLVAAEAFGWMTLILFTFAFVVVIFIGASSLRRGDRLSGGLIA